MVMSKKEKVEFISGEASHLIDYLYERYKTMPEKMVSLGDVRIILKSTLFCLKNVQKKAEKKGV